MAKMTKKDFMEKGWQRSSHLKSLIYKLDISRAEKDILTIMVEEQEKQFFNRKLKRYDLSVAYLNVENMHDAFTLYLMECQEECKKANGEEIRLIFIDILL